MSQHINLIYTVCRTCSVNSKLCFTCCFLTSFLKQLINFCKVKIYFLIVPNISENFLPDLSKICILTTQSCVSLHIRSCSCVWNSCPQCLFFVCPCNLLCVVCVPFAQVPNGVGFYHEPDELPEQLICPAQANGSRNCHSPPGWCHLGGLFRTHFCEYCSTHFKGKLMRKMQQNHSYQTWCFTSLNPLKITDKFNSVPVSFETEGVTGDFKIKQHKLITGYCHQRVHFVIGILIKIIPIWFLKISKWAVTWQADWCSSEHPEVQDERTQVMEFKPCNFI